MVRVKGFCGFRLHLGLAGSTMLSRRSAVKRGHSDQKSISFAIAAVIVIGLLVLDWLLIPFSAMSSCSPQPSRKDFNVRTHQPLPHHTSLPDTTPEKTAGHASFNALAQLVAFVRVLAVFKPRPEGRALISEI